MNTLEVKSSKRQQKVLQIHVYTHVVRAHGLFDSHDRILTLINISISISISTGIVGICVIEFVP